MAHQFTIQSTITGISLSAFKQQAAEPSLHEAICKRIPGENLQIIESKIEGDIYTLKRAYHLDVNIPDLAKKLLKEAFRLKRTDISDLKQLTSTVELGANLPLKASCYRVVTGDEHQIVISLNWTVSVNVPLLRGVLERHAEGEIRKFSLIEIDIVEDELKKAG